MSQLRGNGGPRYRHDAGEEAPYATITVDKLTPIIGAEIGGTLSDNALGLAVWAAVHGLAMLVLENVIDLGQRRSGLHVLPARSEIILRSLFATARD